MKDGRKGIEGREGRKEEDIEALTHCAEGRR
jgi:hypothetical protein